MKNQKDTDLLQAALYGNETALNTLFNHCRPQAYAVALKICGNTPFAEDAVQDAFVIAYTKLHQLKDPTAFLSWLKQIVANCCYQLLRKEKTHLSLPEDQLIEHSIDQHYDSLTQRDALYTALSRLPEILRAPMLLRYMSDFSTYEQIAAVMGIPLGTVRSRLSEGRKQLTRYWNCHQHADSREYNNARYWSDLYTDLFPGIYDDHAYVDIILNHLQPDFEIVFTSGKTGRGRQLFADGLYDDFEHGSRVSAVTSCISSGNMSVLKMTFKNAAEYPLHCPPDTFLTIYRQEGAIRKMHMYHGARNNNQVLSKYA